MSRSWFVPTASGIVLWGTMLVPNQHVLAQAPVEFVPQRAALVVAVDDPCGLLDTLESLPLDRLQDEVPAVRMAMMSPQLLAGRGGLMWAEGQLGTDYRDVLSVAAGKGLVLGFENEKSIVIITKSSQPERLAGLLRAAVQLASGMKVGRDAPMPEPSGSHRGIDAYKIGELAVAKVEDCLVMASNGEIAKATIDKILDGADKKLWKGLPAGEPTSVRMLVRHEAIPNIESEIENATGPNRDFGQELLFGGVLSALSAQGASTAVLRLTDQSLVANWRMLDRQAWGSTNEVIDPATGEVISSDETGEEIVYGRGELSSIRSEINGLKPAYRDMTLDWSSLELPSNTENAIAQLTVDRDLALLWAEKDTLLTENVAAQLDVADSQLSTAFGGFDFGDEVLGAVSPTLRIVVFPPANADSKPPVLPEAAVMASLRADNPQQVARRFRIAWQTVIGIVNVERGGNGQPQLELETLKDGDLQMMTGRYSIEDARELNAASVDLYSNLAPTIATSGKRIAIATSDALAENVIRNEDLQPKQGEGGVISLSVDGDRLASLLKLNRPALLAQNMMEKGSSKSQAENEIDSLIGGIDFFKALSLRMAVNPGGLVGVAKLSWRR